MKQIEGILAGLFLLMGLAGCGVLDFMPASDNQVALANPSASATIRGKARFYPWDTHDLYSTANLSGYVDMVVAGESDFSILASAFSFFNHYYLEAPFETEVQADGPVPLFLFSRLHYSDPPLYEGPVAYAGVAMAYAEPGEVRDMDDGIPQLQFGEYQDFYVPLELDETYEPAGNPVIESFVLESDSEEPMARVSVEIANTDLSVAVLKINNSYRLLDLTHQAGGRRSFDGFVDLLPGVNRVSIAAVSTEGYIRSEERRIRFSAPDQSASEPDIFATLTWDWPSSDMDLFVWYFDTPYPSDSDDARWLAEARNGDIPGAPDPGQNSGFFGGGEIGDDNGGPVNFAYDADPAVLSLESDSSTGEYSLSIFDGGAVAFDLSGELPAASINPGVPGTYDLGRPEMASGFFSTGGFGFATLSGVTGTLTISHARDGEVTGTLTLEGEATSTNSATDFILSFSDAAYQSQGTASGTTVNRDINMDMVVSEAYGPEHFTLYDAPDGYYVVAVASISMDGPDHSPNSMLHTRTFLELQAGGESRSFAPHWFEHHFADDLTRANAPYAVWHRFTDIRMIGGETQFLTPDSNLNLAAYPYLRGLR